MSSQLYFLSSSQASISVRNASAVTPMRWCLCPFCQPLRQGETEEGTGPLGRVYGTHCPSRGQAGNGHGEQGGPILHIIIHTLECRDRVLELIVIVRVLEGADDSWHSLNACSVPATDLGDWHTISFNPHHSPVRKAKCNRDSLNNLPIVWHSGNLILACVIPELLLLPTLLHCLAY